MMIGTSVRERSCLHTSRPSLRGASDRAARRRADTQHRSTTWSPRLTTWTSTRWLPRYCAVSRASRSSSSTYTTRSRARPSPLKYFIAPVGRELPKHPETRGTRRAAFPTAMPYIPARAASCDLRARGCDAGAGARRWHRHRGWITARDRPGRRGHRGDDGGGALVINPARWRAGIRCAPSSVRRWSMTRCSGKAMHWPPRCRPGRNRLAGGAVGAAIGEIGD